MELDPLLTSLVLSRSEIRRRNRETWTDIDWEAVKTDPDTKVLVLKSGKIEVIDNQIVFSNISNANRESIWVDLGIDKTGTPYLVAIDESAAPAGWSDLREVGAKLNDLEVALLVTSVAIANWHRVNKYCPNCGSATLVTTAGWTRECPDCKVVHHPRTDAAIICLVVDDQDRALLGSRINWPDDFFSTFAGFVESGESAEMTVIRELREEAGVEVAYEDIVYRGSQVWPFPASLMLGYQVKTNTKHAVADGYEISEVRWYTRSELKADCESGKLSLPSKISIARALIEEWYGAELPQSWLRP